MVRRGLKRWSVAALSLAVLVVARPASADRIGGTSGPVTFTGNVETDMASGTIPDSQIISGGPADRVAQAQWMSDAGYVTGWAMKDVRFNYDKATDTMQVGVNFYGVAGDADGNGDPGLADPRTTAAGGIDLAHLGGRKSISVAFAPDGATGTSSPGTAVVIAGVSADKSKAGPGIDGFNVSKYVASNAGIAYNYGATLTNHLGTLAFDPSKEHPDFEFSIKNFSKIPGLNSAGGFWFQAFAGSPDDVVAGEESVGWTRVNGQFAPQTVPEPTTLIGWSAVLGAIALQARRARKRIAFRTN